jgi:hypothetical protein
MKGMFNMNDKRKEYEILVRSFLPPHISFKVEYLTCHSDCGQTYFEITLIDKSTDIEYKVNYCPACRESILSSEGGNDSNY